jgi:DNA repair exonuclease SbcCD ATPase subunit
MSTLVPEMLRSTLAPLREALNQGQDDFQELLSACAMIAAGSGVVEDAIKAHLAQGVEASKLKSLLDESIDALEEGLQQFTRMEQKVASLSPEEQAKRLQRIEKHRERLRQIQQRFLSLRRRLDRLAPSAELAEKILQELAEQPEAPAKPPRRSWRELRGILPQGVYGADAQAWVSDARRASDDHRELRPKDTP